MESSLLALLVGLALADSLNPFSIGAQAYLLSTARPFARSWAFLLATSVTYFGGGMMLLYGFDAVRDAFVGSISPVMLSWLQIALGLALMGFAVWSWARGAQGKPLMPPKSFGVAAAFSFGFVSTMSDLPTALPLVVAAERIAAAPLSNLQEAMLMAVYAVLYSTPLVALVIARAGFARQSEWLFSRIQRGVDWAVRVLLPPLISVAGAFLVFEAIVLSGANA